MIIGCPACEEFEAARKKAAEPKFNTKNNPLATQSREDTRKEQYIEQNMDRLYMDARRRRDVASGAVYSSIMNMRYGE